jgi:hypothetical protein
LHQSMWGHETLYTDRYSKDKRLSIRQFLLETKNMKAKGGWKLRFIVSFIETAHEPLHLVKLSLIQLKITDILRSFI